MLSHPDEPQPRLLNHPSKFTKFGNPRWHLIENVNHAATRFVRGCRGHGLVMPKVSVGKGRNWASRNHQVAAMMTSGFMAWHVISDSGNGKRFHGIFAMRRLYSQRTLDREYVDILCKPRLLGHDGHGSGFCEPRTRSELKLCVFHGWPASATLAHSRMDHIGRFPLRSFMCYVLSSPLTVVSFARVELI